MSDKKTGILLLSHGSRLDDGEEVIKAYKDLIKICMLKNFQTCL